MSRTRRLVLAGTLVTLGLLASVVLFDVLGTVFFAVTVAYVLAPLHRRLVERGVPSWWASVAATVLAFLGVVGLFASVGFLVYRRRSRLVELVSNVPQSVSVDVLGVTYTVDASVVVPLVRDYLTDLAIEAAQAAPVLAIQATLFALVVFALLVRWRETRDALLAPIPTSYWDVLGAFHDRTRETLYAIYVLQVATAAATALVAIPVFLLFGFDFALTLGLIAGFLQFVPVVGPSFLVALLSLNLFGAGQVTTAALLLVVGAVVVGWLPDAVVRPRLARETTGMPGSLYFVGFTGGLLSVGLIGFIAGPLVVALVVEATELLSGEVNGHVEFETADDSESGAFGASDASSASDAPDERGGSAGEYADLGDLVAETERLEITEGDSGDVEGPNERSE